MRLGFGAALGAITSGLGAIGVAIAGCFEGAGIELLSQAGREKIADFLEGYLTADQVSEILRVISRAL